MALENIEDLYRLSPVQQGMLFHTLAAPGSGVYFEQFSLGYGRGFDPEAFARAWQRVVDRHPGLRTSFLWEDLEEPVQVVHRHAVLPVDYQDWRSLPGDQHERLRAYAAADRRSGFDLARPPLLRLALIRTGEQEYQAVWSYHHLLLDGWSAGLVMREVFALYREETAGEPAPREARRSYRDYVDWLFGQDLAAAEAYWRRTLAGFTTPTPLGVDAVPSGPELEAGYDLRLLRMPEAATAALKAFAQSNRLTLNTLVQGAWALLLARTSGAQDVVFGATVSGRPPALPGVEAMIGCFINTLPVRVRVAAGQEPVPWLRELQGALAAMRRYEHTPLARVLGWSEVPRPLPLFESIVVFESFTPESAFEISHSGVFQRTNYPLTLATSPGTELVLRIGYEPGRFGADAIERLLRHLEVLLQGIAAGGPRRLDELPLLTPAERHQVLVEWNCTQVEAFLTSGLTLHALVAAQAARTPEAVALVFEGERLTYRELNARANRLARHLQRLGVGPEAPVGVCLERSVELVVALLGILKAGAAYLPLDPSYPAERLAWTLADACRGGEPPVLLVQQRLLTALPESVRSAGGRVVHLEAGWGAERAGDEADPEGGAGPDHAAYVIYTSGSTGRPKGVVNTHRGIVNRLLWMQATYRLSAGDRVLQKTPFSFDVSVWELFWPLLAGARLVVARPGGHQDPAYLARLIVEQGITTLHFVPPMLQAFLDEQQAESCTSLRRVIASGEALSADLVRRFHSRFAASGVELHNLYGPTEAAVDVTFWPCTQPEPGPTAPIGRPVANTAIRLLGAHLEPVPIGVPGELHIGGVQLARGYLGRPALTAEKFIPDPFGAEPGARLYATGDLARCGADGAIEFLGRIDHQVKVRGFRIELGEIEAILRQHPTVDGALVIARESAPGERSLVAYIVAAESGAPTAGELRRFLAEKLPAYMIPAAFITLAEFPLGPNGKVDRRALPAPEQARPELETDFVPPQGELEEHLAAVWSEVLGVAEIGATDDFFTLGGDSFKAMRVVRKAGASLRVVDLFQNPTIRGLAGLLSGARQSEDEDRVLQRLTRPAGTESLHLVCVPYGGGSAIVYQPLAAALAAGYVVSSVALPGHDVGRPDEPLAPLETVARACVEEIRKRSDLPVVLYGHCLGVALTVEIARRLEEVSCDLRAVFLGGAYPPRRKGSLLAAVLGRPPLYKLDTDAAIHAQLKALGGFEGLADAQELEFVMRSFRHDGQCFEEFFAREASGPPRLRIVAPTCCVIGAKDPLTAGFEKGYRRWEWFAESVELIVLNDGGHYFIKHQAAELAQRIAGWIAAPATAVASARRRR